MSEWKECKLGHVATVHGGKRLPKGKLLTTLPTHHPYIRIADFSGHKIVFDGIQYVDDEVQKEIAKYTVEAGDLVISIVGTLGLCAIIPKELHKANLTENCAKIHIKDDNVEKLFLYYHLINTETQDTIVGFDVGSTQPKLPLYNVQNIDLLLPPLPEQRAIAGVLSSLDDKIELLHRQNKTLERMAEALWRKMFLEETDPEWKRGKLGDEMCITMGQSPPGNSYNEEKQGVVFFQGRAEFDFRFPQTRLYCTEPRRFAKKGDTLVSVRAPVGDINMVYEDCCIGRGLASVIHKRDYTSYTFYKIRSLKDDFDSFEQQGTVFGSIGKDDFNNIDTFISSEKAIQEFEHTAKPMDDKIFANSIQIRMLSRLRDMLLPKLMSGEVRVDI